MHVFDDIRASSVIGSNGHAKICCAQLEISVFVAGPYGKSASPLAPHTHTPHTTPNILIYRSRSLPNKAATPLKSCVDYSTS